MRTILVVDDDPWVRVLARDVLAGEGYRVLEAADGQDAIRVAAEHPGPIHLLLTDVVMPLLNGRELVEQMRKIRPAIKFLYMSGYSTEAIEDYGIQLAPGEPFVVKPFTTEGLAKAVRAVLDYRSPFGKRPAP